MKRITILMVLGLCLAILFAGCGTKTVAIVNGEKITQDQLSNDLTKRYGKQMLDELISKKLIEQECKKDGIVVSEQEINDEIEKIKKEQPYLEMMLKMQGMTIDDLKETLKITIPLKKLVLKNVTEEEKQAYFEENKDKLIKVHAYHILIKTDKAKAEKVLKELQAGKDFTAAAKEYSEDESNKDKGGDLGFFTYSEMVPEFSKEAFILEPDTLSGIVKTKFGYHIIIVKEKKDKYEDLKAEIEEAVISNEKTVQYLDKLKQEAKIENFLEGEGKKEGEEGENKEKPVTEEKKGENKEESTTEEPKGEHKEQPATEEKKSENKEESTTEEPKGENKEH